MFDRIYWRLIEKAEREAPHNTNYRQAARIIVALKWGSDIGLEIHDLIERSR